MRSFARITKLHNIVGRGDYISNPDRQENIVAASEAFNWEPYQTYERDHQRTNKSNNEGREIILQLPNEWANLAAGDLIGKAQQLAETAASKKTDMQWAVHWNKDYTNLHMHVVFSERERSEKIKQYDRDVYHTADGKVARSRADRARDDDGNFLPPVHRKGEIANEGFTAKNPRYTTRAWTQNVKDSLRAELVHLGATLEPHREDYELTQYHHGKGPQAAKIAAKNEAIESNNARKHALAEDGRPPFELKIIKQTELDILRGNEIPVVEYDKEKNSYWVSSKPVSPSQMPQESFEEGLGVEGDPSGFDGIAELLRGRKRENNAIYEYTDAYLQNYAASHDHSHEGDLER